MNTEIATNVIENNILIDIFMGNATEGEITLTSVYAEDLKYHSDWNSLMPVVEKIDALDFKTLIGIEFCEITRLNRSTDKIELIVFEAKGSKKESVFQAVVEFVKWLNANPDFSPAKQ